MVSKAVVIFIFTATVASGRIIQWPRSYPHPMVFMPATGSLNQPQLFASPYIQPVVENCDEAQPEIVPLPMPHGPVLRPIEIPKYTGPMMVGTPIAPIGEPCEPAMVPERPAMDIPAPARPSIIMPAFPVISQAEPCLDEVVAIPQQPEVPQPPELPAFVMPELPAVAVPMPEPCLEDQPLPAPEYVPPPMPLPVVEPALVPEMPVLNIPAAPAQPEPYLNEKVIEEISYPMVIPQAPELPAFVMPELPVRVETPVPAPIISMPIEEPYEPAIVPVPVAPELPPLATPTLPEFIALPEPCLDEIVVPEVNFKPMVVPQPPELPAFIMPELPVKIEAPIPQPQPLPVAHIPEYIPLPAPVPTPIEEPCEPGLNEILSPEVYEHIVYPQAPELPAFVMAERPAKVKPMIAPCPEDIPVAIPQYVQPIPLLPAPEVPKTPKFPVRVEMPSSIIKPDPCVGEVVPQLAELIPTPIMPSHPEPMVDPCDSAKPAMMVLPPYFASHPSYMPMGFFPSGNNLLGMRAIPYVRHH